MVDVWDDYDDIFTLPVVLGRMLSHQSNGFTFGLVPGHPYAYPAESSAFEVLHIPSSRVPVFSQYGMMEGSLCLLSLLPATAFAAPSAVAAFSATVLALVLLFPLLPSPVRLAHASARRHDGVPQTFCLSPDPPNVP